jgi:hypothetical protein
VGFSPDFYEGNMDESAARAVLRVFVVFLLVFVFDSFCFRVLVGRGFGQSAAEDRTVRGQANSP